MELRELYDMIGLQPEIIRKLKAVYKETDLTKIDAYLTQMMNISTAPKSYQYLKTHLTDDRDNIKMLYCQLECARRVYDKYQAHKIPDIFFIETMKCFSRFIKECGKKNGRLFFDRGWWTYRQISMNLFRIGTLEYQFREHQGERVIGIHIPSDADLSTKAVDHSLEQADIFFHTYYGSYEYRKYTCDSWLMSPALKTLLSEEANILSFQQRFHILWEDRQDKEYIEWLFQVPADTVYDHLPETTNLQRKVKNLLLDGGTIGSAYGMMEKPEMIHGMQKCE